LFKCRNIKEFHHLIKDIHPTKDIKSIKDFESAKEVTRGLVGVLFLIPQTAWRKF